LFVSDFTLTKNGHRFRWERGVKDAQVLSVNELMSLTGHESESALKTYLNIDRLETSSKASEKIREALKQRAA